LAPEEVIVYQIRLAESRYKMIHFACRHCGKPVRVADVSGGQAGRCPFCKALVSIPAAGEGSAPASKEVNDIAAALDQLDEGGEHVPPPPGSVEEPAEEDLILDLTAAGDPRMKTDRLEAITESPKPRPRGEDDPPDENDDRRKGGPDRCCKGMRWFIVVGVVALVLAIGAALWICGVLGKIVCSTSSGGPANYSTTTRAP
jgi:phage FluMu protein Com